MPVPAKKKASLLFKGVIRAARLTFTDVTPAQLLTREVIKGSRHGLDTRAMDLVTRAAFGIDDFERIINLLHRRLSKFDKKQWRKFYGALVLLEHLLVHGPRSVASEFQSDIGVITEIGKFEYIDKEGVDWGAAVRQVSKRVIQLLEKTQLLQQERARVRHLQSIDLYELKDSGESELAKTKATNDVNLRKIVTTDIVSLPDHLNGFAITKPVKENVAKQKLPRSIEEEKSMQRVLAANVSDWKWEDGSETDSLLVHQKEKSSIGFRQLTSSEGLALASLLSVV